MTTRTQYRKDLAAKKIFVTREFDAPVDQVWRAWTESKLLDEWWAPKPWKARTKSMDFRNGGSWLYVMEGPDGEKHWSRADYSTVVPEKSYEGTDYFCDENGIKNTALPTMNWKVLFTPAGDKTRVDVELTFESQEDIEKIVGMGFEEGFASAHNNLDELLSK